jgi:adenosylcobyric acid synthase
MSSGFLTEVAASAGRDFRPTPDTCFRDLRQDQLDLLGDLVADHLDTRAVRELIHAGAPVGLPVLPPAGAAISSRSPAR